MEPEIWDRWEAFFQLSPWGGRADDERLAFALMNLVQAQVGGKWIGPAQERDPNRESFTMADFMLRRLPQTMATEAQPERWEFDPPDPFAAMKRAEALIRAQMR